MDRPRPVALGAAGGSLGTALLGLVSQAIFQDRWRIEPPVCVCPDLPPLDLSFEDNKPWIFLGTGIAIGICFGPVLDICLVLRERWRRFVIARLFGGTVQPEASARALYKVLS